MNASLVDGKKFPYLTRWHKHVKSFTADAFKGEAKPLTAYGPADAPKAEAAAEDEDDIDLFGSDDEVDEAAEKLKQQRLAEYHAKKANSKCSVRRCWTV